MNLATPLTTALRTKKEYYFLLEELGLKTVRDLLEYYPRAYGDESDVKTLSQLDLSAVNTVQGTILNLHNERTKFGKMIQRALLTDIEGNSIEVIWFNQPHLVKMLREGAAVILSGKIRTEYDGRLVMQSPKFEYVKKEQIHTGRLVPIYPQHALITSQWLREKIYPLQNLAAEFEENLPAEILRKENLIGKAEAVREIHFPSSPEKLTRAQERLAFEELFTIQLRTLQRRQKWEKENAGKGKSIPLNLDLIKAFLASLPFTLTESQKIALFEILKDLEKPVPMLRLLEGDVGSGKTVVALAAGVEVISAGYQVLFLSPTEILAQQHFKTIRELGESLKFKVESGGKVSPPRRGDLGGLKPQGDENLHTTSTGVTPLAPLDRGEQKKSPPVKGDLGGAGVDGRFLNPPTPLFKGGLEQRELNIALLTGSTKAKEKKVILEGLASGEIDLVVGTHALIQDQIQFKNLGLAVIDEQHRFGVEQRDKVESYGHPHILNMTATPIPRTLAIVAYGDQSLSVIKALPHGRKPVVTKVVTSSEQRKEVYRFIEAEIQKGRQIFVICPLVNDSESEMLEGVKSATQEYEYLRKEIFPQFKLGLVHGQLKPAEKEKTMEEFHENELQILVATSVIEVGIDIPNATMILIEGAERFGLAQLHQFRGRVGRGEHQSYCFLFPSAEISGEKERLQALEKYNDGFMLAEIDLRLRGPGEVYGTRQSGIPDLKMATLTDALLLKRTRSAAEEVLGINGK